MIFLLLIANVKCVTNVLRMRAIAHMQWIHITVIMVGFPNNCRSNLGYRKLLYYMDLSLSSPNPPSQQKRNNAQFLKPMAVTIVFGLMGSTLIVLVLVPVLLAIQGDLTVLVARYRGGRAATIDKT